MGTRLSVENSSPQLKFVSSVEIRRFSWNSSPQLKFVASAAIRLLSCNSSPQLQFVASFEIRRLKTNATWRDRRHETAHRLVICTSTELLVLTQTAPHSSGHAGTSPRIPGLSGRDLPRDFTGTCQDFLGHAGTSWNLIATTSRDFPTRAVTKVTLPSGIATQVKRSWQCKRE